MVFYEQRRRMTNSQIPASVDMANKLPTTLSETSSTGPGLGNLGNFGDQSVAGEEDPGASLSIPAEPSDPPSSQVVFTSPDAINPGDKAPEGMLGTAKGICRECGGSGRMANQRCASCDGSGMVNLGLGQLGEAGN